MGTVSLSAGLDLSRVEPPDSVPSMISLNERKLLYSLVRDRYRGDGYIVDAGTFLGASSVTFGEALRDRAVAVSLPGRPIQSFDRCVVTPHMLRFLREERHPLARRLRVGEDFSGVFRELTAHVADLVELNVCDLGRYHWSPSAPIELLFVDIAKTEPLHRQIVTSFMPALVEGAHVVQQDFFFDALPWIKVTMAHLRDHFAFLGEVHASAVFRCTDADWCGMLERDPWDRLDVDSLEYLHDTWLEATRDRRRRALMELSGVRLLVAKGAVERAAVRLQRVERDYRDWIARDTGYASLAEKVRTAWAVVLQHCARTAAMQLWPAFRATG